MAQGTYKNGVAIEVTYQAVNNATGKTITMDVYDEAHAKDVAKCVAEMTEIVATGRYYASFTPDAEGIWTVIMLNTTDSNGPAVKQFAVGGHDVDSLGDAVAALNDISTTEVATELATYDAPTKAELDSGLAGLNDLSAAEVNAEVDTAITDAALATAAALTTVDDEVGGIQSDLDNATDGLGAIKDAVDAVSVPAMVG